MTLRPSLTIWGRRRRPMSTATRQNRERFKRGDLISSYGQTFECFGVEPLPSGQLSQRYRLRARCDDCGGQFGQVALRSDIKADRLRRRCDDCKEPMRTTRPVARYAIERRRKNATERATKLRDAKHLSRLIKAAHAAGSATLAQAFAAEHKGIRRLPRAHMRSANLLSISLSAMAALEVERRVGLLSSQEATR
jgi:hypothetical protein